MLAEYLMERIFLAKLEIGQERQLLLSNYPPGTLMQIMGVNTIQQQDPLAIIIGDIYDSQWKHCCE